MLRPNRSHRGYTWSASVAEVRVAVAKRDLEHAEHLLGHANERLAADPEGEYRAGSVTAWTDRVTQCLAELDAAMAAVDGEREASTAAQHGQRIREGQQE
jgi:hypothetical protein